MTARLLARLSSAFTTVFSFTRSDGSALSVSDVASVFKASNLTKSSADAGGVAVSDSATIDLVTLKSTSDTGGVAASGTASVSQVLSINASDTSSVASTETPSNSGSYAPYDREENFEGRGALVPEESLLPQNMVPVNAVANGTALTTSTTIFSDGSNGTSDGTMTHSNLQSIVSGGLSFRVLNPIGASNVYKTITSPNILWRRVYFRCETASPTTSVILDARLGATSTANVQITSTRNLRIRTGTTVANTFATVLATGTWYRVEHMIDTVAGQQGARLFYGANLHGTVPDEEIYGSYTLGAIDRIYVGLSGAGTLEMFWDAYADSTVGWVGPFTAPGVATGSIVKTNTQTATKSTTDTGGMSISGVSTIDIVSITSSTDTGGFAIADSATVSASSVAKSASDTGGLAAAATATVTTSAIAKSASDTGGIAASGSSSISTSTPGAVVTRFRAGAWHEKPLPSNAPVHSNNANLIKELCGRYAGSETDGHALSEYQFATGSTITTTLAASITSSQTTMTVTSSAGFPAAPFSVKCQSEWITVKSVSGTTWTILRGSSGTVAASHASGTQVQTGDAYLQYTGGKGGQTFGTFDMPVYNVTTSDPNWILVDNSGGTGVPPQFKAGGQGLRIPNVAKEWFAGGASSDSPLIIYDANRGYYATIGHISWNATGNYWEVTAGGAGGVVYTSSYGIDSGRKTQAGITTPSQWPATLPGSGVDPSTYQDEMRNMGIRGNHSGYRTVDFDRLTAEGLMAYCPEGFCARTFNGTNQDFMFPMSGTESAKGGLIKEGARCRIKSTVNVTTKLTAAASSRGWSTQRLNENLAIAKGLQQYGIYWGDNAGGGSIIKLDAVHRKYPSSSPPSATQNWAAVDGDLDVFPFATDWEFIVDAYDPP